MSSVVEWVLGTDVPAVLVAALVVVRGREVEEADAVDRPDGDRSAGAPSTVAATRLELVEAQAGLRPKDQVATRRGLDLGLAATGVIKLVIERLVRRPWADQHIEIVRPEHWSRRPLSPPALAPMMATDRSTT